METDDYKETSAKVVQLFTEQKTQEKETVEIYLVEFLLEHHLTILGEQILQKQITAVDKNPKLLKLQAKILLQKGERFDEAIPIIHDMLRNFNQDPDAWTIAGDFYFLKNSRESIETYSHALSLYEGTFLYSFIFSERGENKYHVMMRLGQLYQKHGRFASAKNIYLKACQLFPSAFTWMCVGIACYSMGDLQEAQDALAEANMLNPRDARVWAYISLLCFRSSNNLEAQQAFREAIKFDLSDPYLLMFASVFTLI